MAMPPTTSMTKTEMIMAMEHFKLKCNMKEVADFDLENCREVIQWSRFLWRDNKRHATFMGTSMAILLQMRMNLINGMPLDDLDASNNVDHDPLAEIEPMLIKIQRAGIPMKQIQVKIQEIHSALTWMFILLDCPGRPGIIMAGTYAILSDTLNHLICFTQMIKTAQGELTYPEIKKKTLEEDLCI